MKHLDLSAMAWRRKEELYELFRENCVPHPNPDKRCYVLPVKVFEKYAGVSAADHPLLFRPEIFDGGDCNSYWENDKEVLAYLSVEGLFKAVTVLETAYVLERKARKRDEDDEECGQPQSAACVNECPPRRSSVVRGQRTTPMLIIARKEGHGNGRNQNYKP